MAAAVAGCDADTGPRIDLAARSLLVTRLRGGVTMLDGHCSEPSLMAIGSSISAAAVLAPSQMAAVYTGSLGHWIRKSWHGQDKIAE